MNKLMRHVRRLLTGTYPSRDPIFGRIDVQFCRAQYLVRFYYLASVFISYSMMPLMHSFAEQSAAWDFLWPVAWLSMLEGGHLVEWLSVALLFASLYDVPISDVPSVPGRVRDPLLICGRYFEFAGWHRPCLSYLAMDRDLSRIFAECAISRCPAAHC